MIIDAIKRAYKQLEEKNWDKIYWAIDMHGTCLKSSYKTNQNEWINEDVIKTLQLISSLPESMIILWSSVYPAEQSRIIHLFRDNNISIEAFNENPFEKNTNTGDFREKFYFNILLDDKAGFDPEIDWKLIYKYLTT